MITRRTTLLTPLALLIGATRPAYAAPDLVLALDLSGPRPTIHLSVGDGEPEPWVFDTGAAGSVIDAARAEAMGLPRHGAHYLNSPAGGVPVEGFATVVRGARADAIRLPDFDAVAAPLPGPVGAGVLSPSVFSGRLVTLDLAHALLRVSDRNGPPPPDATPYSESHPLPTIGVTVAGRTYFAHIDTGAPSGVTFPYDFAASLPLSAAPERAGFARFVDGEHARYRSQVIGEVRVGPLRLTDPTVHFIDGLPFVNVGSELVRRLVVTLDPERRLSWAVAAT